MQVERSISLDSRRIRSVLAGEAQFSTLTPDERTVAHATIDARMAERVAEQRFGPAGRCEPARPDRRTERSRQDHLLRADHRPRPTRSAVRQLPLELSGHRVAARVASGGHDVPASRLATRYDRLWPHVATAAPHCRRAVFYDNATDDGPREVASFRHGVADYHPRWPAWTPSALRAL